MTYSLNSRSLVTYRLAPIVFVCKDETGASQPFIKFSKIPQSPPQFFAAAGYPGFDCPDPYIKGERRFLVAKTLDIDQYHGLSERDRKVEQSRIQGSPAFTAQHFVLGARPAIGDDV